MARYLCRALGGGRWTPSLFAGSLGTSTESGNAGAFFADLDCNALDYTLARSDWEHGRDPMAGRVPMHASFEAKSGVPDRIFFSLDDAAYRRQVDSWTRFFAAHRGGIPDVVHLHHLTPMHEAVRRLWPRTPIVTHLHGTELKMLASVDDLSANNDTAAPASVAATRWTAPWIRRMRRWAAGSRRIVTVSAQDRLLAEHLLPINADRVRTIANGVDTSVFTADRSPAPQHRLAQWSRWLVEDPRGWRPGHPEGSLRYSATDVDAFVDDDDDPVPVVLFVGRFMSFKRVQLLVEAHHRMLSAGGLRSVLVIAGGYPGEWEGEHPYDTVQRLDARDVFFVGWRGHEELAAMLACADVFAAPSVDEPFGLVYLEAMAAGVAPIATATGGPLKFINTEPTQPTGWLVAPDDCDDLVRALTEAVSDAEQRTSRGKRAAQFVGEHYSWARAATSFETVYDDIVAPRSIN